jgi:hypothetical protein
MTLYSSLIYTPPREKGLVSRLRPLRPLLYDLAVLAGIALLCGFIILICVGLSK